MARDSGRNHLRGRIAHLAARIMAEDGVEDYALAKRKAARQAGVADARQLPNNDEVDAALKTYRDIYQQDHGANLRALRELALAAMRELAQFNPHLTGSVLKGSAGKYAPVSLQLFTDSSKSVELFLLDRGMAYKSGDCRLYAGDIPVSAPIFTLNRGGVDIHLTVLSPRDQRVPLKTTPEGKPIERAKVESVAALLAAG